MNIVAIRSFLLFLILKPFLINAEVPNYPENLTPKNEKANKPTIHKIHEMSFMDPILKFLFAPLILSLPHIYRKRQGINIRLEKKNKSDDLETFVFHNKRLSNAGFDVDTRGISWNSKSNASSQKQSTVASIVQNRSPESLKMEPYTPLQNRFPCLWHWCGTPRRPIKISTIKLSNQSALTGNKTTESSNGHGRHLNLNDDKLFLNFPSWKNLTFNRTKPNCFRRFIYMWAVEWRTVVVHIIIAMIFALSITLAMLLCYSLMPVQEKAKETGNNKPLKENLLPTKFVYV